MIAPIQKIIDYSRVPDHDHEEKTEKSERTERSGKGLSICCLVICNMTLAVLATILGFYIGRSFQMSALCQSPEPSHMSAAYFSKTFTSNVTFSKAPSPETNGAWESLYPGMHPTGSVPYANGLICLQRGQRLHKRSKSPS